MRRCTAHWLVLRGAALTGVAFVPCARVTSDRRHFFVSSATLREQKNVQSRFVRRSKSAENHDVDPAAPTNPLKADAELPSPATAPGEPTSSQTSAAAAPPEADVASDAHVPPQKTAATAEGNEKSESEASREAPGGLRKLFASWQQGVVTSIGAVMGIGFLVYILYAPVKEDTVHHTAVVASEALADIRLKAQAVQLSKDVVSDVLKDPKSLELVVGLVGKLLAQNDTRVAISSLLQSLFEDHYTQEVTKKFVLTVVGDPWIQDQLQVIVKEQVLKLLDDDDVKVALSNFLLESCTDSLQSPVLHYEVARTVRSSLVEVFNPWHHM